jgi:phosphoserine phosphatase
MNATQTTEAAIFDVDDTLCDTFATRDGVYRPVEEAAERWLAAAPIAHTVEEAMLFAASGIAIVLITARGESIADATAAQIESYGVPVAAVYARKVGDNRVDWKVKTEALAAFLADGFTPVVAFDDKPRNLDVFAPHCDTVLV